MQADPIDLPRLALDLIQTVVPAHLDDDTSCMALFGARVYEELSTQRVYKQMALLLHPDKRPVDSPDIDEYSRAFVTLGSLCERVTGMALAARRRAKSASWRYPAEVAFLNGLRRSRGLPPQPAAPSPPVGPSETPVPEAILNLTEHINLDAPRMAQNLLATRSLRIGGDAGRSWAEVVEEYLDKAEDRQRHGNI